MDHAGLDHQFDVDASVFCELGETDRVRRQQVQRPGQDQRFRKHRQIAVNRADPPVGAVEMWRVVADGLQPTCDIEPRVQPRGRHDLVRVYFTAELDKAKNGPPSIDFDVTYFLQRRDSGPKVFAFISEDEMSLFRDLGLVDADGKPV